MNQRYRNDDDFGRRPREDEIQHRYAHPSADARFERDHNQQNQDRYRRDDNSNQNSPSRNFGPSNNYGSNRSGGSGRGGWEEPPRSSGQWPGNRETFDGSARYDSSSRTNQEWQGSRFSGSQDSNDYRGYGNRDYSRPGASFSRENPLGVDGSAFDDRNPGQGGNLSFRDNGRQALGFYSGSQQRRGEHFGKGPKGYQRSDERIREDVCDRLAQDDALDARNITVTTSKGEVTLEGSVPDRFSKHRAEDIVDSISGVVDINNRLKVDKGFFEDIGGRVLGSQEHSGHAGERPIENKNGQSTLSR